jgi:hypothetical protein
MCLQLLSWLQALPFMTMLTMVVVQFFVVTKIMFIVNPIVHVDNRVCVHRS